MAAPRLLLSSFFFCMFDIGHEYTPHVMYKFISLAVRGSVRVRVPVIVWDESFFHPTCCLIHILSHCSLLLLILYVVMSRRFKRVANTERAILTRLSQDHGLVPVSEVAQERRPYASRDAGLLIGHQGLVYGPTGVFSHVGPTAPALQGDLGGDNLEVMPVDGDEAQPNASDEQRAAKNQRLWDRWMREVIPTMVKPLLELHQNTSSLRDMAVVRLLPRCPGCENGCLLPICCIFFESKSYLRFWFYFVIKLTLTTRN